MASQHQHHGKCRAASSKSNWFPTLWQALDSENLDESWPIHKSLSYGETYSYTFDDGTRFGHFVSVYRNESGLYERPVHYKR